MYGERAEETEELKLDIQDLKSMYRQQVGINTQLVVDFVIHIACLNLALFPGCSDNNRISNLAVCIPYCEQRELGGVACRIMPLAGFKLFVSHQCIVLYRTVSGTLVYRSCANVKLAEE